MGSNPIARSNKFKDKKPDGLFAQRLSRHAEATAHARAVDKAGKFC